MALELAEVAGIADALRHESGPVEPAPELRRPDRPAATAARRYRLRRYSEGVSPVPVLKARQKAVLSA